MNIQHNTKGGSDGWGWGRMHHTPEQIYIKQKRVELTVCFVCLVKNIPFKGFLLLHGGVKLWVIVLKQELL